MNHTLLKILAFVMLPALFTSCCHSRKAVSDAGQARMPGPRAIIYQTHTDYLKYVPVILSEDRKSVESYPDIKDIYFQGRLAMPTVLHGGWLLDNRGISRNVAFIRLTYDEYAMLPQTPSASELYGMIIDKDPVTRMYDCGLRSDYQDIENELNKMIDAGKFSEFKLLK